MILSDSPTQRFAPLLSGLILIGLILLIFGPMATNMVYNSVDYYEHIDDAQALQETGATNRPRPHTLYHRSVGLIHTVFPGVDYFQAALILDMLTYVCTAILLFALVRQNFLDLPPRLLNILSVLIPLVAMLVWAITIFSTDKGLYFGYTGSNPYHNPTINLLRPLAVLLFLLVLRAYDTEGFQLKLITGTAVVVILATMAKPSYTISLLPGLGVFTLYKMVRKETINWWLLIIGIGIPAGLVLFNQYVLQSAEMGGMDINPFFVMEKISYNMLLQPILSMAFPVVVYLAYFRQAIRDDMLNLAWLVFGAATAYMYLLSEGGYWQHLNFYWGPMICMFILFAISIIFFLRQNVALLTAPRPRLSPRVTLILFILLLHLASGIHWYGTQVRPEWGFSL